MRMAMRSLLVAWAVVNHTRRLCKMREAKYENSSCGMKLRLRVACSFGNVLDV